MSNRPHRRPGRRRPSPAAVALLDQADAANRQTFAVAHVIGEQIGAPVRNGVPGPVSRTLWNRLHRHMTLRAIAGEPCLCKHLSYQAPTVAFWLAWAPDLVRCGPCGDQATQAIRGTPEDRRCDACGTVNDVIHQCVLHAPPVVLDLRDAGATSLPPMLIHYGLCRPCLAADKQEVAG